MSKYFLLTLSFLLLFTIGFSQDSNQVQSDEEIKDQIEEIIEEGYVRIPKKDFDTILENRISNHVNSKLNALIGLTVGLITLLSLLSIFQFNKSRVSNEKLIKAEVTIAAKEAIEDMQKYFKDNIENKLSEMEKRIEHNIDFLKKENENSMSLIHAQIEKAKKQVSRAEKYMTNLEIKNLKNVIITEKNYQYPEDLKRTQNLLENIETSDETFQIPTVVNILSYIYYDQKQYNEVNDLISKYENKYNLHSNTFINGALTALYDYHNYNTLNQRDKCIEYLDKSLELTQGYGEALGLKLEVFMMDFMRTNEPIKKEEAKTEALKVINGILNGESKTPAYETISRLSRDAQISSYKKYVSVLFKELPVEMKLLMSDANELCKTYNYTPFEISEFVD